MQVFDAEFIERRMQEHRELQQSMTQRLTDQIREEVLGRCCAKW